MRVKDCCYLHSSKLSRFRTCCAHSTTQFHSLYSINYTVWNKQHPPFVALVLSPRAVFKIKNIHQIHHTCAIIRAVRSSFLDVFILYKGLPFDNFTYISNFTKEKELPWVLGKALSSYLQSQRWKRSQPKG